MCCILATGKPAASVEVKQYCCRKQQRKWPITASEVEEKLCHSTVTTGYTGNAFGTLYVTVMTKQVKQWAYKLWVRTVPFQLMVRQRSLDLGHHENNMYKTCDPSRTKAQVFTMEISRKYRKYRSFGRGRAHSSPCTGVDHQIQTGERGQCENKVRLPLSIDAC